jgi:hypothetical protein
MASRLGPLEIHCDAPSYTVVRACQRLGFESPEDVRWFRLSHFLADQNERGTVFSLPWKLLFGKPETKKKCCTCGQGLPLMEKFTFTFLSDKRVDYLLGQCTRCHTIFWDEA